jgi:hypothetical protein
MNVKNRIVNIMRSLVAPSRFSRFPRFASFTRATLQIRNQSGGAPRWPPHPKGRALRCR